MGVDNCIKGHSENVMVPSMGHMLLEAKLY